MTAFAGSPCIAAGVTAVYASGERKARDGALILARRLGLGLTVVPELRENDRSMTGCLKPAEFEAAADRLFAEPLW